MAFDVCNAWFLFDCFYCLSIVLHVSLFLFLLTVHVYSYIQLLAASVFIKLSVNVCVRQFYDLQHLHFDCAYLLLIKVYVYMLYKGHAAGPHYNKAGSGSNFLCLPNNPQWKNYTSGNQPYIGEISGIEYQLWNSGTRRNNIFSQINNGGNPLLDNPAPCAVCYVGGRSTILMIPAKTQCPDGWTTQYAGYLASESHHASNKKNAAATFAGTRHRRSQLVE